MIDQALLGVNYVIDADQREIQGVRNACPGIQACRSGWAFASSEYIRADNEIFIRIKSLSRADKRIPPAGIIFVFM